MKTPSKDTLTDYWRGVKVMKPWGTRDTAHRINYLRSRRFILGAAIGLAAMIIIIATAVVTMEGTRTEQPESSAQTPSQPVDLSQFDYTELISWSDLFLDGQMVAPTTEQLDVIRWLIGQTDERYRAFLVDLAFYPTVYRDFILQRLLYPADFYGAEASFELAERAGVKTPADDLPAYGPFKQRLMETINPEAAAFIDPNEPRAISAQEVIWGGVCVDCIPALDDPQVVTAPEASTWLGDNDVVVGVEINGDARAYPLRIIDWHVVVNDTVGGVPVSLTHCTLCGDTILYDGRVDGQVLRFGTSGLVYRGNSLLYDRGRRTLWEQYTGQAIWGDLSGQGAALKMLPAVRTTWREWLNLHPQSSVLDINTGFVRDYSPGALDRSRQGLSFPAPAHDGPLQMTEPVFVVRIDGEAAIYPMAVLAAGRPVMDSVKGQQIVVVATPDGYGARAFESSGFRFTRAGKNMLSSDDGSTWRITEDALVSEDGSRLQRLPGFNSLWFAAINHSTKWRLYGSP
jgi:hypothetical protein